MAPRKKAQVKTPNGDRVTNRDLMAAVQGIHTRIDDVNKRVDESLDGQRELSGQMTKLNQCMENLRATTNDRLHLMENDITALKRPWTLVAGGWRKAGIAAGAASAITSFIMKFGVPVHWPF